MKHRSPKKPPSRLLTESELESLANRKPATNMVGIPVAVLDALSAGRIPTKNLVEWLAADRWYLLKSIVDELELSHELLDDSFWTPELNKQGALKKSFAIAKHLYPHCPVSSDAWRSMLSHKSDIVREWAALIIGLSDDLSFARKLAWMKTLADDEHSGTREIAWLALRHHVAENPQSSIRSLTPWSGSRNERLRRFASEITRPRGVWTSHIQLLKESPELGIPILEPLLADDSKYVQNSVGNWLNDASKSNPQWVQQTTQRWLACSDSPHTRYIVKRALRTLNKEQ
jgi:3-methyladenine DNA glycosylase AlkC